MLESLSETNDELFKIVARSNTNQLMKSDNTSNYIPPDEEQEITKICIEYQIMSKYTSLICVHKNLERDKPSQELKQVLI